MAAFANIDDAAWAALFDEEALTVRRDAAEKRYRDLTGEQIRLMRRRCKMEPFFLASVALEYELLSLSLHNHYMSWLKWNRGYQFRMSLLPRDHYKSTANTETDSVQMALPVEDLQLPHPYNLGPNIKLLLTHEVHEHASRFLYKIGKAFREKPLMLVLYPELIPSPRVQRMNKTELELPRDVHHAEPTFDTLGVAAAEQGRHYNWLKIDDPIGKEARDSITVMLKVKQWFDNITSLLTRPKYDGFDLIGTRWSADDVYSHAVKVYGVNQKRSILRAYDQRDVDRFEDGAMCIYARGAIENGLPIFPEEFTLDILNRIRRNPMVWAAQYANNPREGAMTKLDQQWLKFYNVAAGDRLVIFEGNGVRSVRTRNLDRVIMIDPSVGERDTSDETGFVVTGTDPKMNIYVLEAFRKRMKPPELIDELFRLYTKWNPRLISIESVAFSALIKYWFEQKCVSLGVYPAIYDYKRGPQKAKQAYIEALGNYGAAGQIYIMEGMHQLRDEWEWFPLGETDHILDAMSQGPEVWAPGRELTYKDDMKKAMAVVEGERDDQTGYSSIEYA